MLKIRIFMALINVLVVDDDKLIQQIAGAALASRGVGVFTVYTSIQADLILQRERVDVIICDVLMDEEDGLSYCKRLQDAGCRVPVILLSCLSDPVTIMIGKSSGAAAYMIKPFDTEELYQRVLQTAGSRTTS